jgi:hypothetical protein
MNKLFLSLALAAGALLSLPGCMKKKDADMKDKKEMTKDKMKKGMKKDTKKMKKSMKKSIDKM